MTNALRVAIALATAMAAPLAIAADIGAGKSLARNNCSACHGMDGIGIADQYPNLAGQKAAYMIAQIKSFRDGSRSNPIMSPMAKSLSDRQITDVSAYYQTLSCPAGTLEQRGPAQSVEQLDQ